MVIVNDDKYNNLVKNISYSKYYTKKKKGYSPFFSFKCNNVYICIETIYDIKWIKELKNNIKVDITDYISDIIFQDKINNLSLICGEYNCLLSKINNNKINLELKCHERHGNNIFDIYIKEDIYYEINFKFM